MKKIYLCRFGMTFDDLAASEPFPFIGELTHNLRLVLPAPNANYISRVSYFELSNAVKVDDCPVYIEISQPEGQP